MNWHTSLLTTLALCVTVPSSAQTPTHLQNNPIRPGYVAMVELREFAEAEQEALCSLLISGNLGDAQARFKAELDKRPDNMVAYVGLCQASESFRLGEYKKHMANPPAPDVKPLQEFQYGILLYYRWCVSSRTSRNPENASLLSRSVTALQRAWNGSKEPLIGMMYVEAISIGQGTGDSAKEICYQLLRRLAGPEAYALYEKARATAWKGEVPGPTMTHATKRRPLRAVLGQLWSELTAVYSTGKRQAGKVKWTKQLPTDTARSEAEYILRWRASLKLALPV